MLIDLLPKPSPITMCQWTGANTEQVQAYIGALTGTYGSAEFVADSAEAGRIIFTTWQEVPDKIVRAGDWMHGQSDHYGPFVNVYTPTEINARFQPYPEYTLPVDDPPNLSGGTA